MKKKPRSPQKVPEEELTAQGELYMPLPKAHPETWRRLQVIAQIETYIPGLLDAEEHSDRRTRLAALPLRVLQKVRNKLAKRLGRGHTEWNN